MFESDPHEGIYYSTNVTFKKKEEIPINLWRDHFSRPIKERNTSMNIIFDREYMSLKQICCFLEESQIMGKTFDKFGIPNICGKIWKNFFQQSRKCKRVQNKFNKSNSVYSKNIFGPPKNISRPMKKVKIFSKTLSHYPPVAKRIHDNSAIALKISEENVSLAPDFENKINTQEHGNTRLSNQDDVTDKQIINRNLNCPNQYNSVDLSCTNNPEESEIQKSPNNDNKPPSDEAEINSKHSSTALLITESKSRSSLHLKAKSKNGMKKTVRFNDEYLCRFAPPLNYSEDVQQISYEEQLFNENLKITDNFVDLQPVALNKTNDIHSTAKNISELVTADPEPLKIVIPNTQILTTDFIVQNQEVDKEDYLVQNKDEKVQNIYRFQGNHIKKYNIEIEPYEEPIITEYSSSLSNEDREKEELCSKSTLTNQQFKSLSKKEIINGSEQCFEEGNDFQLIMKNDNIQQLCEEVSFSSTQMYKSVIEETPSISQETNEKHEDKTKCSNEKICDTPLHKSSGNIDSLQDLGIYFEHLNPVEIKNDSSNHDMVDDYIPLSLTNSPQEISQSNTNEHSKLNLSNDTIGRTGHDYPANIEELHSNLFFKTTSENQNVTLSPILSVTNQLYGSPSSSLSDRDYLSNISEYASEDKENNITISNKEQVGYDNQIQNKDQKINIENSLNLSTILDKNENSTSKMINQNITLPAFKYCNESSSQILKEINHITEKEQVDGNNLNNKRLGEELFYTHHMSATESFPENENQLSNKHLLYVCTNSFEITQSSVEMGYTPSMENTSSTFENEQVKNNKNDDCDSTMENYMNDNTHGNTHVLKNIGSPKQNTSEENVPSNHILSTEFRSHLDLVDYNLTTKLNATESNSILDEKTIENLVVENSLLSKQSVTKTKLLDSENKVNKAVELYQSSPLVLKCDSSGKDEDLLCSENNQIHILSNDSLQDEYIILSPGSSLGTITKRDLCLENKTNEIVYNELISLSQNCSVDKTNNNTLSDKTATQEMHNTGSSDSNNENKNLENDFCNDETTANEIYDTPSSNNTEITKNMFTENNEILQENVQVQTKMEYSDTEIQITSSTGSENNEFLNSNFAMKSQLNHYFSDGKNNNTSSAQSYKKCNSPISTTYCESKTKREIKQLNASQHTKNSNSSGICQSFEYSFEKQTFPLQENASYTIKNTPIKYLRTSPLTVCNKVINVQNKPQLQKYIKKDILKNKQCTQMTDDNKENVKSKKSISTSSINSCHKKDWNNFSCVGCSPEDQVSLKASDLTSGKKVVSTNSTQVPPINTYNSDMIDHDNILTVKSDNITPERSICKKKHLEENIPSYFQDKERERYLNSHSGQSKLKLEAITKVPITIKEVVIDNQREKNILNNFKLIQCLESVNNNNVSQVQSYDKCINTPQKSKITHESLNNKLNEAGEVLLTSDSEKHFNDSKFKYAKSSIIKVSHCLSQSKNEVVKSTTPSTSSGYRDNDTKNVEVSGIIHDDVSTNQVLEAESVCRIKSKHLINENKSSKRTRTNIVREEYCNNYSQSIQSKTFSHFTTKPLFLFCNQGKVDHPSSKLLCKTETIPICTATDIPIKKTSNNLVTKENSVIDWNEKDYFSDESKEHHSTMSGSMTKGTNENILKVTSYDASTLQLQKSTNWINSQNNDVSEYIQDHNYSLNNYFDEEENNLPTGCCDLFQENLHHCSTVGNDVSEDSLSPNGNFLSDFEDNHFERFLNDANFSRKQIEKRKHLEQSSNQTSDSECEDVSQKRMKYSSNSLISEDKDLELTPTNSFSIQNDYSQFEVTSNDSGSLKTESAYPSLSDEDQQSFNPEVEEETTNGNFIIELFSELEDDSDDDMSCTSPASRPSEDDCNF